MSEVVMPRLSDTMEEGELAKWLKNVGDPVSKGDVLAEIETDKATMDLEAFESGVLEQQLVTAGTVVPIGTPVAVIGDGSGKSSAPAAPATPATAAPEAAAPAAAPEPAAKAPAESLKPEPAAPAAPAQAPTASLPADARLRTSPLARKIAKERGIDLSAVQGSGPQGRIVRADVEAAISGAAASTGQKAVPQPSADGERVAPGKIRTVAAKRLSVSQAVPHFFLTSVVDVEKLLSFRSDLNEALAGQGIKASVNDLIVKAVAVALRQHPEANASWVEEDSGPVILRHSSVNIGIAVATDAGLLVPVIRDADSKSLAQIASDTISLAEKARAGKLGIDEMSGGTFSVSNLGMFGIDQFTAMLNPPEAGILAVGAASPVPVLRNGGLVEVPKLKVTLTVDHRVMDGAVAAGFLKDVVANLEKPLLFML
ncbi:MAG: 2-oxo acid dehydrogenase subunit E2 [Homoserinimonas sp.]|nr:2-oxo acid dehydrogenase subunit E2 [Homoserinimonas sp.]MCW5944537.1 2-oxo acid dehydrogenase subunit E2 [Cryobacterium sp.]